MKHSNDSPEVKLRCARAAMRKFEAAVRDHAFKGAAPVEDRPELDARLRLARLELETRINILAGGH
jgi:hypothetical protein